MKRILLSSLLVSVAIGAGAKTPQTSTVVARPGSAKAVFHPQTEVAVFHPVTTGKSARTDTRVTVFHPQTNVSLTHPTTQTDVFHPTTQVAVQHPTTTVEVFHPQTEVAVFHPQTPEVGGTEDPSSAAAPQKGGKSGSSSQVTTSMSDFKPMQAKNFSAPEKAAPTGGGDLNLGNATNQTEKDNANKSSLLGAQNNQDMQVDPKQTQLKGLEKLLTDRAKVNEKKM